MTQTKYEEWLRFPDKELEEANISIQEQGEYKNVELKNRETSDATGIREGEYLDITKVFADGIKAFEGEYGPMYNVKFELATGEEVSTLLNKKQHDRYKKVGGEGDTIRALVREYKNNKGNVFMRLEFELLDE